MLQLQRFGRDEKGIQLVEAAIVVPIFLILFAAVAEFGRYFYEYTTLAKAARAGARYLSTVPVDPNEDLNAQKIVVYGNTSGTGPRILDRLELSNVAITRAGGPLASVPDTVTVSITGYQHQSIFNLGALLNNTGISTNVEVKPSVTMRFLMTDPPPLGGS
jgi:Flp pilus assembly protein TadG